MIASFKYNFIFIKTRKVGGTSTEIALSLSCGPEDIVAPLALDDEIIRTQLGGGVVIPRNYAQSVDVERAFGAVVKKFEEMNPELRGREEYRNALSQIPHWRRNRFHPHMTAAEASEALGAKFWNSAFKFTIERHPYDRAVSGASHRLARRGLPQSELTRMIDRTIKSGLTNEEMYLIDDKLAVDEIVRYEALEADLDRITAKLGMDVRFPLPRTKAAYRVDRRPAHEVLTDEQKRAIYEKCRPIFDRLGYEP